MTIETTINISKSNKILIENAAFSLKTTKNEIIKNLMLKFLNDNLNNFAGLTRIKYQKKEIGEKWKSIHVWFSPEFYDKCQDIRKFHKLSISHILSIAINLYLKKNIEW